MKTPLKITALHDLLNEPVLFDANIFMVGIENRGSDKNCSFDNMKKLYIEPLFKSFTNILIHEQVYNELDHEARAYVDSYVGKSVTIVTENGLYGVDPIYTTIFNNISSHNLVRYNSLGKYQILSTIKSRSSMNKTCSKCDSFQLYQRSGRIRDSFQAAYGKSICL